MNPHLQAHYQTIQITPQESALQALESLANAIERGEFKKARKEFLWHVFQSLVNSWQTAFDVPFAILPEGSPENIVEWIDTVLKHADIERGNRKQKEAPSLSS